MITRVERRAKNDAVTAKILHTSQFKNAAPFRGKKVVVIGAGNSSVDICQDLAEGGAASVTMIQRTPMCVAGRDVENVRISAAYSPDLPIDINDFKIAALPRGFICKMAESKPAIEEYFGKLHKDVVDKVQKGGFMVDFSRPQISLWLDRLGGECLALWGRPVC